MTPPTRLVTLVFAISLPPYAMAADSGSDVAEVERRLQATFEGKIEAVVEQTLKRALERKVAAEMDELMVREQYRLAWRSRHGSALPAAPAPQDVAGDSRETSTGASGSSLPGAAEEPLPDTLCTFSPPSTFVCVLRAKSELPASGRP